MHSGRAGARRSAAAAVKNVQRETLLGGTTFGETPVLRSRFVDTLETLGAATRDSSKLKRENAQLRKQLRLLGVAVDADDDDDVDGGNTDNAMSSLAAQLDEARQTLFERTTEWQAERLHLCSLAEQAQMEAQRLLDDAAVVQREQSTRAIASTVSIADKLEARVHALETRLHELTEKQAGERAEWSTERERTAKAAAVAAAAASDAHQLTEKQAVERAEWSTERERAAKVAATRRANEEDAQRARSAAAAAAAVVALQSAHDDADDLRRRLALSATATTEAIAATNVAVTDADEARRELARVKKQLIAAMARAQQTLPVAASSPAPPSPPPPPLLPVLVVSSKRNSSFREKQKNFKEFVAMKRENARLNLDLERLQAHYNNLVKQVKISRR
jgi:hypothetical protein